MNITTLTSYFLNRLDTAGLGKLPNNENLKFNLGYLLKDSSTKYEFVSYDNYYTEKIEQYVPCMVTYTADPLNIPNQDVTDWTMLFEYILTGENENDPRLLAEVNAIEEFRVSMVNTPLDDLDGYKLILSPKPIVRSGDIKIQDGYKRLTVSMEIRLQSGIGIGAGNDDTHQLKFTTDQNYITVFPTSFTIINGSQQDTVPNLGANSTITQTQIQDTTIIYRYSLLYNDSISMHVELLKLISGATSQTNAPLNMKISFPRFTLDKIVVLVNGSYVANGNDIKLLNFDLGING